MFYFKTLKNIDIAINFLNIFLTYVPKYVNISLGGVDMSKIKHGRGYAYFIRYHIVWCVKYRKQILLGELEQTLKDSVLKIATDNGFEIGKMKTDKDHVHLLIDCSPQHSIPSIIKVLKGVSARTMFQKHPELKKQLCGGNLWNPSYFVATASENIEEQIRQYIQKQKAK